MSEKMISPYGVKVISYKSDKFKDMRTKTPKQIHEQWQRIKGYVRARGSFMAYFNVYAKYCNRMAIYNGKPTYWLVSRYYYDKQNNNPVPVSYYTKVVIQSKYE